jgi:hypothetical protein
MESGEDLRRFSRAAPRRLETDRPDAVEVRPQRLVSGAVYQSGSLGEAEQLIEVGKD